MAVKKSKIFCSSVSYSYLKKCIYTQLKVCKIENLFNRVQYGGIKIYIKLIEPENEHM